MSDHTTTQTNEQQPQVQVQSLSPTETTYDTHTTADHPTQPIAVTEPHAQDILTELAAMEETSFLNLSADSETAGESYYDREDSIPASSSDQSLGRVDLYNSSESVSRLRESLGHDHGRPHKGTEY